MFSSKKKAGPGAAGGSTKMSDPYKWTLDEVGAFLDSLDMGAYKKNFRTQEINGASFMDLNEADMLSLKLTSPSERAKLIVSISQLKAKWARKQEGADDESSESTTPSTNSSSMSSSSAPNASQADLAGQIAAIRRTQCVITFALDGTILEANDNFLQAMGYTLNEVKGRHHSMFVTPDYASSREYTQFWEKLRSGEAHAAEFKRIAKGGREVWLQATYSPILDGNGKPWKVVKYATKSAAKTAGQADYASQIEAIRKSQCVITFGIDGTVIEANENFLNAMGYTVAEVKGRHHSMFVTPEYAASRDYQTFWERLKSGDYNAAEFKRIAKGGREVWLQATYSPILDGNGKVIRVVKYATNVTEQKRGSGEIQFKCSYGEELRVLEATPNVTLEKFLRKVKSSFGHRMNIKYTDKSGDLISVKSDDEFRSMISTYKDQPVIRLQLTRRRSDGANSSGVATTASAGDTTVLESMINPVIIINTHGIIMFANGATSRVFGYGRGEMQGQNVRMLMPQNVAERHDSYLSEYLRTGVASIIGKGRIVEGRRKDGSLLSLDLAVSHSRNAKRGDTFTGTFSEVQRPGAAPGSPAAHSANAGLSVGFALLENLLFAAIVADSKGQIMFANGHAGTLFGYGKVALVGKNVRMLMPNPDSDRHDSYLRNYLETRQPKVIGRSRDVIGMMKDGSLVPLNLTISEQVVNSQSIFTAILRPLSEDAPRTDAKSIMQAEREMLATLAVPGVMIDEKGSVQGFNEAAEHLWGWKLTEVVGKNVKVLMPNPERDRHDGYLKRYLETGKQRVFGMGRDVTAVHKDGSMLPVRLSVSEKKDEGKRVWTAIVQKLN